MNAYEINPSGTSNQVAKPRGHRHTDAQIHTQVAKPKGHRHIDTHHDTKEQRRAEMHVHNTKQLTQENIRDKKRSQMLCHRLARQQGFCDKKERRAVWSPEAPREPPCARFDKQLKRLKEQRATFYRFKQQHTTN